jgi:tetratricopeptide (TPR) repeat protein
MIAEAASASRQLVFVFGARLNRIDDARRWAIDADPLSRAVGAPEVRAAYLSTLGTVARVAGEYGEARQLYTDALAIQEQAFGPDDPNLMGTLNGLGSIAYAEADYPGAVAYYERALAIQARSHGPDHPNLAFVLSNLGLAVESVEQARAYFERSLTIRERALGPEHPDVAISLNNLGIVARTQGQYQQAYAYYERALAIKERASAPDDASIAISLINLGNLSNVQGDYEQAYRQLERARVIHEAALGPDHPMTSLILTNLGQALLGLERPAEAVAHLEHGLAIQSAHASDPIVLAQLQFQLARALWSAPADRGRDRKRALELARLAHAVLSTADPEIVEVAEDLPKLDAWLAEHGASQSDR